MEKNSFELILQTISAGLIGKIISDSGLNEDVAVERFYSSELYSALEKEETKVWHYSVSMLYNLYKQEMATGRLTLPEF
jgi:hypothetical protein